MKITSKANLLHEAKKYSYKPELLEKVLRLLDILQQLMAIPYLRDRFVLKGGTALNLFHFPSVPRLSVDIDLNYIGQLDREKMLTEKAVINDTLKKVFQHNQFELMRHPSRHAGGKMVYRYPSLLGQGGTLEIDLNYMYRQPLWDLEWKSPRLFKEDHFFIVPVLDIHELAAGKLSALFSRRASRDLFDAHYLLTQSSLSIEKLRLSFVIYLAMSKIELADLTPNFIEYDLVDIRNQLFPLLYQENLPLGNTALKMWANKILDELRQKLNQLLPLKAEEKRFISQIREENIVDATLLTEDALLRKRIETHPAIQWARMQ